ncbi:hypothetical protein BJV77DRAFT_964524 [Russula vinacea]|nr:hypothetical protein BJV77DRAFT_964524 [Russula vinacea]
MTPLSGGLFLALQLPAFLIRLNPALYISARAKEDTWFEHETILIIAHFADPGCKLLPTFSTLPVNNGAKEMTKLAAVIQVPFRSANLNQFLGEGDLQHANLSRTIDGSIAQHLQKLSVAIKGSHQSSQDHITSKTIPEGSPQALLRRKLSCRRARNRHFYFQEHAAAANLAVIRQLHKQVNEENALQKSVIIMQRNSAHFEGIDTRRSLGHSYGQHPPDHEWISFSARFNHLLDPDKPLRNHETINYPSKEASVFAVHSGYLERKTRFTRAYCENYFVLTPSGFLHEYSSSNPAQATSPLSLFSSPSNGGMIYACSACGISSRDGPRPLGNLSEEEEDEEEEEGSSVEEERHEADDDEEGMPPPQRTAICTKLMRGGQLGPLLARKGRVQALMLSSLWPIAKGCLTTPPDPSTNHDFVWKAHHTGAASWVFESDSLTGWGRAGSFLWTHGKPLENWIHVTMSSPNYIRTMPVEKRKPTTDTLTKDMQNLPGQGPIYIIVDALGRLHIPSRVAETLRSTIDDNTLFPLAPPRTHDTSETQRCVVSNRGDVLHGSSPPPVPTRSPHTCRHHREHTNMYRNPTSLWTPNATSNPSPDRAAPTAPPPFLSRLFPSAPYVDATQAAVIKLHSQRPPNNSNLACDPNLNSKYPFEEVVLGGRTPATFTAAPQLWEWEHVWGLGKSEPSIPYPWDWGQIDSLKSKVQTSIPNSWEWGHAQSCASGNGREWGPKIQGASHPPNRESKGEASIPNPWEWGHAQNWGVPGRAIHAYSRDWGSNWERRDTGYSLQ